MAMEEIRPMLMGMNHSLVFVRMCVANRSGQAGVAVVVVAIIMAVDVFVAERRMHVDVNVALHQKKRYCPDEEDRRYQMSGRE